jgi:hypothetical protein
MIYTWTVTLLPGIYLRLNFQTGKGPKGLPIGLFAK